VAASMGPGDAEGSSDGRVLLAHAFSVEEQ
jgi:hypothetical protein